MAKVGLSVFAAGPSERVSIAIHAGDSSGDVSISPIEALALAATLVRNARVSMYGTKENPIPHLAPDLAMAGVGLDSVEHSLSEFVRLLS